MPGIRWTCHKESVIHEGLKSIFYIFAKIYIYMSYNKMKINVGLIGFGRMGEFYLEDLLESGVWNVTC